MSRFVRPSKYRHVYGEKPKQHYENAKISGSAWDTDLVTAGGKYLAVNWQVSGGGAFAILPIASAFTQPSPAGFPYKLPDLLPLARGHTSPVLDTAWHTFDDNLVASAGEDGKICLWRIQDSMFEGWGEDGWKPEDLSPSGKLNAGGRKVGQVTFHPTASNVLTSASGDHLVRVWDIEHESDAKLTFKGHTDSVQSIAWNYVGTTLATTCRDKKIRLFDPRSGADPVRTVDGHSGVKGSRLVWAGDRDRIITTGLIEQFSRMSDRQMGLWDTSSLENLQMESVDSSAGVLMPFFAEGNDVLFLAGKGDGNIRYFEFENDSLHFLNEYKSSEPQRGMTLLPRRALEVGSNEIARAFKLAGQGIEPLSFIVPRKAESFQSDIFPPACSAESALSASEFFDGKTARPKVIDLETKAVSSSSGDIPSAPKAVPYAGNASGAATPIRSGSTPAPTPAKQERAPSPTPAKSASTPIPAKIEEPEKKEPEKEPAEEAKSLEIEQPDSDDETPIHTPPKAEGKGIGESVKEMAGAAAAAVGIGGLVGAGAEAEKSERSESKSASGASGVTAPSSHLLVKKLSDKATTPTRGSALSAGYDLYAAEQTTVPARGKALVDTQLSIAVPEGTYGRVAPRSGLASKHSIDTGAGVIDADYRGPVMVLLFNYSDSDFTINHGDRIAQLILEKIVMAPIMEVDDLEATARGEGGFGSTGGFGKN